jgi:hypothetical protein
LNAAKPTSVEDDVSSIFAYWIDSFTHWHIKILAYLHEREISSSDGKINVRGEFTITLEKVLKSFPELQEEHAFATQILRDLQERGLIMADVEPDSSIHKGDDGRIVESYTTSLGKRFMDVIQS